MEQKSSTDKYAAQRKYEKENVTRISLKLNRKTDADILEYLESSTNKQASIKDAIRLAIKNQQ